MNLNKPINNLSQRLNKIYSETSSTTNHDDGTNYWRGKKIVSFDQWLQTKKDYTLKSALQFFPESHPTYGLRYILDNIEDPKLKEDVDKWYSEYENLMEHRRNPVFGRTMCFQCLLSPDREQARIFLGINKVIAKALERKYNISSSIYPCPVLNIFDCPYAKKNQDKEAHGEETETTSTIIDVNDLFDLSEIAFQLELALTKAQVITKSNDTIYEANFETAKVRDVLTNYYGNQTYFSRDDPLEEKLAEVKRLSKVPIRNVEDIFQALTNRQTLDNVLDQGLDQEYQKHTDDIVNFFMSIKNSIRKEDLFNAQDSDVCSSDDSHRRRQHYAQCSICQGFANIHCISCNNVWLCVDHWKQHRGDKHNSKR